MPETVSETLARMSGQGVVRPAFFLLIPLADPVRAWSGIGRRYLPADATEATEGACYRGIGFMQSLPELEWYFLGQGQTQTFTLPGVDARTLRLVEEERDLVIGEIAHFGWGLLDRRQRLATPVRWDWEGEVNSVGWSEDQGSGEDAARVRSVSLTLTGGLSDRRVLSLHGWTPTDSDRLPPPSGYARDRGFDNVVNYDAGATSDWPPKR